MVQCYPWFKFYFPLFWGMVKYVHLISLKQRNTKFKPRIKLNHNIYGLHARCKRIQFKVVIVSGQMNLAVQHLPTTVKPLQNYSVQVCVRFATPSLWVSHRIHTQNQNIYHCRPRAQKMILKLAHFTQGVENGKLESVRLPCFARHSQPCKRKI